MSFTPFYSDLHLHANQLLSARYENLATAPTTPFEGQFYYNTGDKNFYGFNGTAWINLSQIITNAVNLKGEISNANTNPAYPSNPSIGDQWIVTTAAGTIGGQAVEIGDELIYSTSGWFILQRNLSQATTAAAGFIRLATQGETNAGSDGTTAISPQTLASFLIGYLYSRKARVVVTSLAANTLTDIVHGLNVANPEDVTVSIYQGGAQIYLAVTTSTVNKIQIQSNIALSNVIVIVQG